MMTLTMSGAAFVAESTVKATTLATVIEKTGAEDNE